MTEDDLSGGKAMQCVSISVHDVNSGLVLIYFEIGDSFSFMAYQNGGPK